MAILGRQALDQRRLGRRQVFGIDKPPVALIERERLFARDLAKRTVPGQERQLREIVNSESIVHHNDIVSV